MTRLAFNNYSNLFPVTVTKHGHHRG